MLKLSLRVRADTFPSSLTRPCDQGCEAERGGSLHAPSLRLENFSIPQSLKVAALSGNSYPQCLADVRCKTRSWVWSFPRRKQIEIIDDSLLMVPDPAISTL